MMMRKIWALSSTFAFTCFGLSDPLWAQCLPSQPCLRLMAVSVNNQAITPTSIVTIQPGDTVVAELRVSSWDPLLQSLATYQAKLAGADAVHSGDAGLVLPVGWDAPLVKDLCPCNDPNYQTCNPMYGCVGPNHDPNLGAFVDRNRTDFVFAGNPTISAADVSSLNMRWGSTINGPNGVMDDPTRRYAGTLSLSSTFDAWGTFEFRFLSEIDHTFFAGPEIIPLVIAPHWEGLTIHVQCDDGAFCNGLELRIPIGGCESGVPPSCDDGLACTMDACDEVAAGCSHVPDDAACDDGDICTRDECTPTGCTHIDDQCGDIPTTSQWGLVVLGLSLLIAAKVQFAKRLA